MDVWHRIVGGPGCRTGCEFIMKRMIVILEWDDEELGEGWMNIDNLKILLYTQAFTPEQLLEVIEIEGEVREE